MRYASQRYLGQIGECFPGAVDIVAIQQIAYSNPQQFFVEEAFQDRLRIFGTPEKAR